MARDNIPQCRQCGKPLSPDQSGSLCEECRSSSTLNTERVVGAASSYRLTLPEHIGPYKILELLGEGGMGDVYLAEQEQPIRRKVAVKIVKLGMDTVEVTARFESERQALALMDHPNIARVIDAGTTDRGAPYFVMEYVPGLSITKYCDKNRLDTAARLSLLIQVCEGAQHAHQKGIIHRDIKPSNILVTIQGDRPVPKIIDFGVAKAINQRLTEKTVFTEQGRLIGTPEYMSPEQAEMSGLDIDTRTDVYSLGVLLYELLADARPFDLRRLGYEAIQRKIREEEPPRPSTKVSSMGNASEAAARMRRTTAASLARQLRGDLDWITMKCLEKDRTRRYSSPSELAADIRRHLSQEPVLASPPSAAYRIQKFVKRHRMGVIAASLILLALLAGICGTTIGLMRSIRAERVARQEAEIAGRISDFLVGLFEVSSPDESKGNSITAREILDRGAERINRELLNEAPIRSRLLGTMGRVYQSLGLYEPSYRLLQQGLQLAKQSLGREHPDIATYDLDLAWLYFKWGRLDEALPLCREALAIRRKVLGSDDPLTARALQILGVVLRDKGQYADAKQSLEESLAIRERVLGPDHQAVAYSLYHLGWLYHLSGDQKKACECYNRALPIFERQLGPDHPMTIWCLADFAVVTEETGKLDEARKIYQRVLASREKVLGPDHPDVAASLNNLGQHFLTRGEYDRARPLFERSLNIMEKARSTDHYFFAHTLSNLASVYETAAEYPKALQLRERALAISEKALGPDHPDVASDLEDLGDLLAKMRDYARAQPCYERSLAIYEKTDGPKHIRIADLAYSLADVYCKRNKLAQAEPLFQKSLSIREKELNPADPVLAKTMESYAALLHKAGRSREAEPLETRALLIRRNTAR